MKTPTTTTSRIIKLILCVVIILSAGIDVHAATFVIQFGGSLGETYSPNTLNVLVGDTIQWMGDFSMHPLSSTSVPTGASTFHQGSGSTCFLHRHRCRYISLSMRLSLQLGNDRIIYRDNADRGCEKSNICRSECFSS